MTEFKGTPGPWRATKDGTEVSASKYPVLEGSKQICVVNQSALFDYSGQTAKANAVLISKAPDLLRQVIDMVKAWESLPAGHNSVQQTQDWIVNTLHPQIVKSRELIKESTEV